MSHSFNARKKLKRKFVKKHGRKAGMPLFRAEVERIVKAREVAASPVPTAEYIDAMTPLTGASPVVAGA